MTKPDDIPQDVWETSDTVIEQGAAALRDYILGGGDAPEVGMMMPFIARAIMAERAACAQVASGFVAHSNTRDVDQAMQEAASANTADSIAAAIRNRGAA